MEPYEQLEHLWSPHANGKSVVACSSGTAALHLALEASGLPLGSRVAVPDYTMVACARAVVLAGMEPVFIDCDERLLMDVDMLEHAARRLNLSAVMAVHVYGRACDMDAVHRTARDRKLYVVEDLAEAHGLRPHPDTDAACWSFYKNKVVAGEEGGAVAFLDRDEAELAKRLRSLGFTPAHDFHHTPRGHNYRMSNAHAKLILASLLEMDRNVARRRWAEAEMETMCPEEWRMPRRDVPWVYDFHVPRLTKELQAAAVAHLNSLEIAARHGFKPMTEQMEFVLAAAVLDGTAASLASELLYFPLLLGLAVPAFKLLLNFLAEHGHFARRLDP